MACTRTGWKEGDPIDADHAPHSDGYSPAQIGRKAFRLYSLEVQVACRLMRNSAKTCFFNSLFATKCDE